jgi:hypothetical protein
MLFEVLRVVHISAASLGLGVLAVPLLSRKGAKLHRWTGWIFAGAMTVTAATGMLIAAAYLLSPERFVGPGRDPTGVQAGGGFLLTLGALLLASLWHGIRAIARQHRGEAGWLGRIDIALPGALVLCAAGLGALAVSRGSFMMGFFAALGVWVGAEHVRFARRPLPTKMAYWYAHMSGMLGASVAALTAFGIFGSRRFVAGALPDELAFLPWVVPPVVLGVLAEVWVRYYRRRFRTIDETERAQDEGRQASPA